MYKYVYPALSRTDSVPQANRQSAFLAKSQEEDEEEEGQPLSLVEQHRAKLAKKSKQELRKEAKRKEEGGDTSKEERLKKVVALFDLRLVH